MPKWEIVDEDWTSLSVTKRMKVSDGWIVRYESYSILYLFLGLRNTMVFVPDPEHKWNLEEENGASN